MKRILLATTAIIGLSVSSAMASDITISGSFELGYVNSSQNDAYTDTTAQNPTGATATVASNSLRDFVSAEMKNGSSMYVQSDVNISFSSTTDSGLTMTMNYGLDENGANDTANTDDINFSISGDFGEIYATSKADDSAARRLDIEAAYTADEASTRHTIEDTFDYNASAGEIAGGLVTGIVSDGPIVSYFLPTLMEGVSAGVSYQNAGTTSKANATEWAVQYKNDFAGGSYTIHYGKGSFDNNGAPAADSEPVIHNGDASGYGVEINYGNFTIGSEASFLEYHRPAGKLDWELQATSVKYVWDDITLAYNLETNDENIVGTTLSDDDIERTAFSISYAIAPGLTANITTSSTKEDVGVNQDTDDVTVFALNATF